MAQPAVVAVLFPASAPFSLVTDATSSFQSRSSRKLGSLISDSAGISSPFRPWTSISVWHAARRVWQRQRRSQTVCLSTGSDSQETVDLSLDFAEEEVGENLVPAPPPTSGRIDIVVDKDAIRQLDLTAAHAVLRKFVHQIGDNATPPPSDPKELLERTVGFVLNYERDDPSDPRELAEMPDIRLWFVRLDATYPWLPIVLDWRGGELARYVAMIVPHQMTKRTGLVFNPEALELFAMKKVFLLYPWLKLIGVSKPNSKINAMLQMLGLGVTDDLLGLLKSILSLDAPKILVVYKIYWRWEMFSAVFEFNSENSFYKMQLRKTRGTSWIQL